MISAECIATQSCLLNQAGQKHTRQIFNGVLIVWHCVALNHKYCETAQALCISIGTVSNVMKIFSTSGDVTGNKSPGCPSFHATTELFVNSMVSENPRVEQHKICEAVLENTGTEVSISTICRV